MPCCGNFFRFGKSKNKNRTSASFVRAGSLTPSINSTSTNSSSPGSIRIKETIPIANKKSGLPNKRFEIKSSLTSVKSPLKESNLVLYNNASPASKSSEVEQKSGVLNYNNNNLNAAQKGVIEARSAEVAPPSPPTVDLATNQKSLKSKDNVPQKIQASKSASVSASRKIFSSKQKSSSSTSSSAHPTSAQNETPKPSAADPNQTAAVTSSTMDYASDLRITGSNLNMLKKTAQKTKDVEALGVIIQYLAYELDAFACPSLKLENTKTKECLSKTVKLLDEARNVCSELEDQLAEKEANFVRREQEMEALHRSELEKAQSATSLEYQKLVEQVSAAEVKHQVATESLKQELAKQKKDYEDREQKMQERIQELECSELKIREQLAQTEIMCANRMQVLTDREDFLEENVKILKKELEAMEFEKVQIEMQHKEKLANLEASKPQQQQHDNKVLKSSRNSLDRSKSPKHSASSTTLTNVGSSPNHYQAEINRLKEEIKSLEYVVELRESELNKMKKTTDQLQLAQQENANLKLKIATLESNYELSKSENKIRAEREITITQEKDELQKNNVYLLDKSQKLSYDNEALKWQLKQRSEKVHLLEIKFQETFNSSHNSTNSFNLPEKSFLSESNGGAGGSGGCAGGVGNANVSGISGNGGNSFSMMDEPASSQPTSPVVKGYIEKNDSVSWTLEMDDETPENAARRVVMRAGSFRGNERPSSARYPSPLAQSMSATTVDAKHLENGSPPMRFRSKSVSQDGSLADLQENKMPGSRKSSSSKVYKRKNILTDNDNSYLNAWNGDLPSSSPCSNASKIMRPRSSSLKIQQIQESAGEAMVSGANSEDESCSACSDEITKSSASNLSSKDDNYIDIIYDHYQEHDEDDSF